MNGYEVFDEHVRRVAQVACTCTPNDVCLSCYSARSNAEVQEWQDREVLTRAMEVIARRWGDDEDVKHTGGTLYDLIERLRT